MENLRVEAHIAGPFMLKPGGTLHLDSMLMAVVAKRLNLPPIGEDAPPVPIQIPLEQDPDSGIYLSSDVIFQAEEHDIRYIRRRFPVREMLNFGGDRKPTINPALGATKSRNHPEEQIHPQGGFLRWYCRGDAEAIFSLLSDVTHVSRMRGHGQGEVLRWRVLPCESMVPREGWEGFPLIYQGRPLRALPLTWCDRLAKGCRTDYRVLRPPYWWHQAEREEECFVPGEEDAQP
jgi:hypothetical protein